MIKPGTRVQHSPYATQLGNSGIVVDAILHMKPGIWLSATYVLVNIYYYDYASV
jgi:hypothetical protein